MPMTAPQTMYVRSWFGCPKIQERSHPSSPPAIIIDTNLKPSAESRHKRPDCESFAIAVLYGVWVPVTAIGVQTPYNLLSMDKDYIVDVTPKPMSASDYFFVPAVLRGLGTTLRHCLGNMGRGGTNKKNVWVVKYPEEKRDHRNVLDGGQERSNFRGVHRLNRDEQGRERCVACFMCSTACPANCIDIVAEAAPWEDREKRPKSFQIDELKCIFCGMCEEACPCDAIELTPRYEIVGTSREEMIFDKEKLLTVYDKTISDKPM